MGRFHVKRIAVVGAGPAGLAAATHLLAQRAFDDIRVFEQQPDVGGVWNYSALAPPPCPVPQTDPFLPPDRAVPPPPASASASPTAAAPPALFPSPLYDRMHANIVGPLMQFSGLPFPAAARIFPSRQDVQACLVEYARGVRHLVGFGLEVTSVVPVRAGRGREEWRLRARAVADGRTTDHVFDAVVVANGHYSVPFIPDIKNIASFHEAHPSVITHSRQYRAVDGFRGKKVVVVGNGPSGVDIARQINAVSRGKTLLSVKSATPPESLAHTGCREVPEIVEFLVHRRSLALGDGTVESDVDAVVFCTGFRYSYPFLPQQLQSELITTGRGVHGLYKHLFCIQHPTLVFPALLMKAIPWPIAEGQAAAVAAVWSNNLELPLVEEMQSWSRDLEERMGEALHVLPLDGTYHYINEFHDWVMKAAYLGKEPPRWSDVYAWQRRCLPEAKRRFEEQGCRATTWEELGLQYGGD